ncbi:MAG: hypothetical protein DRJ68_01090 [Thermoprotei archaeon]|nr:MAG: hypothetical protein DRJ68_01090 [Thermoprotei archaeon]
MMFSKVDAAKYPFIKLASKLVEDFDQRLGLEVIASPGSDVLKRSVERIREAVYVKSTSFFREDLDVEVLSYPLALLIVKAVGDSRLFNLYAEAEKNRVFLNMLSESSSKVVALARDGFDWEVLEDGGKLKLKFNNYLEVAPALLDPYWKLVNRSLRYGYVEVSKRELARLIAEAFRSKILKRIEELDLSTVPGFLKPTVDMVRNEVLSALPKADINYEVSEFRPSALPPCIAQLLKDAEEGKNIPHMARFTLATFLISIGKRPEEVLEVFRRLPDFDEAKTLYHLRHVAGEIGSRTKYVPPSCATLRTFGLCVSPDDVCSKVRHPLAYYKLKLRRIQHGGKGKNAVS